MTDLTIGRVAPLPGQQVGPKRTNIQSPQTTRDQQAVIAVQEAAILSLKSEIELRSALAKREADLQLAVAIWLLASDPEALIVTINGAPWLVHSLIETDDVNLLDLAIRSVVAGEMPRHLCPSCRDVLCGHGGIYCAGALKDGEVPALRVPRKVKVVFEKVNQIRRMTEGSEGVAVEGRNV